MIQEIRVKIKESKKTQEISRPCQKFKKVVEYEGDSITNHSQSTWNNMQESRKENKGTRNQKKNWNCPDQSTTEKNPKEPCCHSDSNEKPSVQAGVKTYKW